MLDIQSELVLVTSYILFKGPRIKSWANIERLFMSCSIKHYLLRCPLIAPAIQPVFLVLQHIPVPRLSIDHINDRLVCLFHATLLNPWLDLLISRKLQHLFNLLWRPNSRTTDLDSARDERESVNSWEVTTIRSSVNSLANPQDLHA